MTDHYLCKVGNGQRCERHNGKDTEDIKDCSVDQMAIAQRAKENAINILKEALNKPSGRVYCGSILEGHPEFCAEEALRRKHQLLLQDGDDDDDCGEEEIFFFQKRYAIITEKIAKEILEVLRKIQFKVNGHPSRANVYAYVYPTDTSLTVRLCELFWTASEKLAKDSQPGTLIHEASHFLGIDDIDYTGPNITLYYDVGINGYMPTRVSYEKSDEIAAKLAFNNANNIEYELELLLQHKGSVVVNGKYACCGQPPSSLLCKFEQVECNVETGVEKISISCNSGFDDVEQIAMQLNQLIPEPLPSNNKKDSTCRIL